MLLTSLMIWVESDTVYCKKLEQYLGVCSLTLHQPQLDGELKKKHYLTTHTAKLMVVENEKNKHRFNYLAY